jgi:hypothetical protein
VRHHTQSSALPIYHSLYGTDQSPFCSSFSRGAADVLHLDDVAGLGELEVPFEFSPLRFRQPRLVSVLLCAHARGAVGVRQACLADQTSPNPWAIKNPGTKSANAIGAAVIPIIMPWPT